MDAGFWTAMRIRTKWARDIASIVFSIFYLFAAERADKKVRKVRGMITVEHMRVAWNKGTTPYLRVLQSLMRPRFTKWPPRQHTRLILDVPGGGFVAMDPRCNDDKLFAWATKSGSAILGLGYKKAPEFPYPYALNEVFDVYAIVIQTRGKCIGMSSETVPQINDRMLTPEMMRAMIILYIGEHNRPDFSQDYLLSPVLAPEYHLARFSKTWFMTGERDPLVDGTVIFAGRLRRAKEETATRSGLFPEDERDGHADAAPEVVLIPGASHGFMQFPGIYPPSWRHFERSVEWFDQLFADDDETRQRRARARRARHKDEEASCGKATATAVAAAVAESSGDEDRPLEISMTKLTRGRSGTASQEDKKKEVNGGGEVEGEDENEERPKRKIKQNKSLLKLKSTDDLLGRRMAGVASGLTGTGEEDQLYIKTFRAYRVVELI
ncbi:Hormone-sensitive lipase [Beauveria bassiana]|nr:Hormone-sensitive lipase [Beauveria bassiana]